MWLWSRKIAWRKIENYFGVQQILINGLYENNIQQMMRGQALCLEVLKEPLQRQYRQQIVCCGIPPSNAVIKPNNILNKMFQLIFSARYVVIYRSEFII